MPMMLMSPTRNVLQLNRAPVLL